MYKRQVYNFPNSVPFKNNYIAVSSITMFYSWFNISTALNNNTFSYTWGNSGLTYKITFPDGLYDIPSINAYFQYICIQNGTYLINGSQYAYYGEFVLNPTRYAVQFNSYEIPTALPTGYTAPSNFVGYPTLPSNLFITITSLFNLIIGFSTAFVSSQNLNNTYVPVPPYQSKDGLGTITYLSTQSPEVQPNANILIGISNIENNYAQPNSIIYSISPDVAVGQQIQDRPPQFMWNKPVSYTHLTLPTNREV